MKNERPLGKPIRGVFYFINAVGTDHTVNVVWQAPDKLHYHVPEVPEVPEVPMTSNVVWQAYYICQVY